MEDRRPAPCRQPCAVALQALTTQGWPFKRATSLTARGLLRFRPVGLGLRLDGLWRRAFRALACDLDATGLDLFALVKHDAQHAVLVLGGRVLRRDRLRQRERARESAVCALDAVIVVRLVLL